MIGQRGTLEGQGAQPPSRSHRCRVTTASRASGMAQRAEVEIASEDPEWLEEFEGAIRQAREGLEKRTTVPCYCEGLRASCPACDGTGQAPKARAA